MKRLFLLALAAAWLARPMEAAACGGFFCNQNAPVVQSSERIVFVDNGDGTITAVIEIVYQGPSTSFSWVLPVSGVPAVEVASTTLLPALSNATRPTLTPTFAGDFCSYDPGCSGCGCAGAGGAVAREYYADAGVEPGVQVVGSGSAGPYDYDVISVNASVPDQADTARTWLTSNGYDVSALGADVLGAYLAGGQNLIAFRLSKSATTGSIRPIVMTYASTLGVIPIRPTAVAAQNDLGVLVFMMGGSRAVPVTYDEIELSEAALDFTQQTTPYTTVVGDAVDEAGGHAFLTEFAGMLPGAIDLRATDARAAHQSLVDQPTLDGWALVAAAVDALDRDPTVFAALAPYDGLVDALVEGVPGMTASAASSYVSFPTPRTGTPAGFDRAAFLDALDRFVVAPRELSEDIANRRPYVTRLFTTIDPLEMTVDPVFAFASGLPTVGADRTATVTRGCVDGSTTIVRIDLADGTVFDPRRLDATTPKVLRRIDYDLDGSHVVVTDNTAAIEMALRDAHPRTGDSCATGGGNAASQLVSRVLFALGVLLVIRRMRPRAA